MLSKNQLLEHLKLQNTMNSVVNFAWLNAGYRWTRAIMVEGNEALDHYGWKWWKKDNGPNIEQVRIELIDIWHFVLSAELVFTKGDSEAAADNFLNAFAQPQFGLHTNDDRHLDLRSMDFRELIEVVIGAAAFGDIHLTALVLAMQRVDLTPEMLHHQYIQKNVLNMFRQANGYKEGTYIKDWNGLEDNEVLSSIMVAQPDLSTIQLAETLASSYAVVLAGASKAQA